MKTNLLKKLLVLTFAVTSASLYADKNAAFIGARDGNVAAVVEYLDAGGKIDEPNRHGRTLLHVASCSGQSGVVNELLARRASVNFATSSAENYAYGMVGSQTALHFAVAEGFSDVVTLLLNAGADVFAKNSAGWHSLNIVAAIMKDADAEKDDAEFAKYKQIFDLLYKKYSSSRRVPVTMASGHTASEVQGEEPVSKKALAVTVVDTSFE